MYQSPVTLGFGFQLLCSQYLCTFLRLVLYCFGKGFLHALVLSFQLGVFLFDRCGFADPHKTADTIQYAVHFRLTFVFELLLLFGNLAVEGKTVLLFRLVLVLYKHEFRFGFLLGGDGGLPCGFRLFRFLFLLGDDEVRALQMFLARHLL